MALIKVIETSSGSLTNYHHIKQIEYIKNNLCRIAVASYKDLTARQSGKSPVEINWVMIPSEEINMAESLLPQLYAELKSTEKFEDATDA